MNMNWAYEKIEDNLEPPKDLRAGFNKWNFPEIPIDSSTKYGWRVFGFEEQNQKKLKIGFRSDISAFTVLFAHSGIIIEPYVQIGPHASIISKSTIDNKSGQIQLKRNCRIGAYSTIMPGITIGENSIIGAYSFVNQNIPDNVIAMGIPCKTIKQIRN